MIDVVPVTPRVKLAPIVKVVPELMMRLLLMAKFAPVIAVAVPFNVRFVTVVIAPKVSAPEPERMRLE